MSQFKQDFARKDCLKMAISNHIASLNNINDCNNYDLKPCPFCGNEAVIKSKPDIYGLRYYVMCGKCETKTHIFEKCVDAVELWNKRISDN
jgi:Lar family restriction alleviation protein